MKYKVLPVKDRGFAVLRVRDNRIVYGPFWDEARTTKHAIKLDGIDSGRIAVARAAGNLVLAQAIEDPTQVLPLEWKPMVGGELAQLDGGWTAIVRDPAADEMIELDLYHNNQRVGSSVLAFTVEEAKVQVLQLYTRRALGR